MIKSLSKPSAFIFQFFIFLDLVAIATRVNLINKMYNAWTLIGKYVKIKQLPISTYTKKRKK